MKSEIVVLAFLAFVPAPAALAHEGHDKAFGTMDTVESTTQRLKITAEGRAAMGIKSSPVKLGAMNKLLSTTGKVEAAENRSFDITPTVTCTVKTVYVKLGDTVSSGQRLASVYSPDVAAVLTKLLEDRAKMQAEIARVRLQNQRDVTVQSKDAGHFQNDLKREELLLQEGLTARKNFIEAEHAYDVAQTKLEVLKRQAVQDVALFEKQFSTTTQSVKSQLMVMGLPNSSIEQSLASNKVVSEIPIVSPVSGIVTFRDVTQGETLSSGKRIFSIVNLSPIWITSEIYQDQLSKIKLGQKAKLTTADGKVVIGSISNIGTVVDPVSKTIKVRVETLNKAADLKPDMFVTTEIVVDKSKQNQIIAPASAILDDANRSFVYVQYGEEYQPVTVKVGSRTAEEAEILDGLFEGDMLVVHGGRQLKAQSTLLAGGAKTLEVESEDHKHTDKKAPETVSLSVPNLLGGVLGGVFLTLIIMAIVRMGGKKASNFGRKSED